MNYLNEILKNLCSGNNDFKKSLLNTAYNDGVIELIEFKAGDVAFQQHITLPLIPESLIEYIERELHDCIREDNRLVGSEYCGRNLGYFIGNYGYLFVSLMYHLALKQSPLYHRICTIIECYKKTVFKGIYSQNYILLLDIIKNARIDMIEKNNKNTKNNKNKIKDIFITKISEIKIRKYKLNKKFSYLLK